MKFRCWLLSLLALLTPLAGRADPPPLPDTITIPLQLVNIGGGQYKLGIEVSLGGGASKLYEFDTGASGMYAANSTAWWPADSYTVVNATVINQHYNSGADYEAVVVNTSISLGNGAVTVTGNVAQIRSASGGPVADWNHDVAHDIAPLYGAFFGDFGSDLASKNGLFAILPQLPGNLSSGFIVHTGGYGNPNPTLQIGITDADRLAFPYAAQMRGEKPDEPFPNSNLPSYTEELIAGTANFTKDSISSGEFSVHYVLDTGAPSMKIHNDSSNVTVPDGLLNGEQNRLLDGVSASLGLGNLTFNFITGDTDGLDKVQNSFDTKGYINAGLNPYMQYDVMFDVQQGYVRFRPTTVPEPGTTALLVSTGAAALAVWRRKRSKTG